MPGMDWDEIEKRMHREAEEAANRDRMDEIIADDIKGVLSMSASDLEIELIKEFGAAFVKSDECKIIMADYRRAIKAAEGGLFSSPDLQKARKIINDNPTLFKINDKKKSWWDCSSAAVLILIFVLSSGYFGIKGIIEWIA